MLVSSSMSSACTASLCSGVHTTNISTLLNWCTRYRPRPAAPARGGTVRGSSCATAESVMVLASGLRGGASRPASQDGRRQERAPCHPGRHRACGRQLTRGAGLRTEAVPKGCHLNGELCLVQDLIHVQTSQGDLCSTRQAQTRVAHAVDLQARIAEGVANRARVCFRKPGRGRDSLDGRQGLQLGIGLVCPAARKMAAAHRAAAPRGGWRRWEGGGAGSCLCVVRARLEAALFKHGLAD